MNWVVAIWASTAAVCFVFAGIHAQIWLRHRTAADSGAFAAVCVSLFLVALLELSMMYAATKPAYIALLRAYYGAILLGFASLVFFVRAHLKVGRRWLGWLAIAMRAVATVAGLLLPDTLHFRDLQALEPVSFLGAQVVVPRGTPNPWLPVATVSGMLLSAFLIDAIVSIWRQRRPREAVILSSALLFFVVSASGIGLLVSRGVLAIPFIITISFIPIILIMGARLSQDLVSAVRFSGELAEAERLLLASRQRLVLAAEGARVSFWTMDTASQQFRIMPLTPKASGIGFDNAMHLDQLLGAVHPDDRDLVRATLEHALQSSDMVDVEYRVIGADGRVRWRLSAGGGRYAGAGIAPRLMGITMGITGRKLAEEAVQRQREEIEHLARIVTTGEMSDALVHELKQPLAIIMANAEAAESMLQGPPRALDEVRDILVDIIAANDRASQVIDRLRSLLRRGGVAAEPLSLCELVEGVQAFVRPDLMRRGMHLVTAFDRSIRPVLAERVRLEQVVINLIMNAVDAMVDTALADRRLTIRVSESGGQALLEVSDRGRGLPAPAESVFAPFFTTKSQRGGMGLAICRSIIEFHGGRIWAENNADGGACFRVQLPFAGSRN